jgi:hypothetical protein
MTPASGYTRRKFLVARLFWSPFDQTSSSAASIWRQGRPNVTLNFLDLLAAVAQSRRRAWVNSDIPAEK